MAIAGADSFLTAQAWETAETDPKLRRLVLRDLKARLSFEAKLARWPVLLFGRRLDLDRDEGARLLLAKSRRNACLHGVSDDVLAETLDEAIALGSDPDLHPVTPAEAADAVDAALWLIGEFFRLRGLNEAQIRRLGRIWAG